MRATVVLLLVLAAALALLLGPREPVDSFVDFDPGRLPADLDAWLAEAEAGVPGLRPGNQRRIVWAGAPGERTPLAVVYLHGFSASPEEVRPLPDRVAASLGANLHFARLTGHGQDGAALAAATAGDWIEDTAEAIAIGQRLGERVLLVGTSTGGTLAAFAATHPVLSEDLAGVAFLSPNFALADPFAFALTWPWARRWLPLVVGAERSWTPTNAAEAQFWTHAYPSVAVLPMAALVAHVAGLDKSAARAPALFLFSEEDVVVAPAATLEVFATWGGPTRLEPVTLGPGDDPAHHILAGDIRSPGQTDRLAALIAGWARGL